MSKFSVSLPDEAVSEIDEAAAAAGITRAEWIRQTCTRAIAGSNPEENPEGSAVTLSDTLGTLERTRENLARITAEREDLAAEVAGLTAEIAHRDQVLAEKRDEVAWLRGQVALLSEKLAPAALPEKAGPGRRPWWRFWERGNI